MLANPPGSIFKLVNAAVALQLGAISPATGFRCDQSLISCVHRHPPAREPDAGPEIQLQPLLLPGDAQPYQPRSRQPGRGFGRPSVTPTWPSGAATPARLGLDSVLGVDIPREAPGFLPTPAYYDKARRTSHWTYRSIYSLSIGQGEINLTGLQMANMVAIIANRGWYYPPSLRAQHREGRAAARASPKSTTPSSTAVKFAALVPGMVAVMQRGGTAETSSLADVGITVAGKTGTVQNDDGDDHAAFVGFAPAGRPKIAVAVYLENAGFGATAAAPCAVLVMEKYLRGSIARRRKRWEARIQQLGPGAGISLRSSNKPAGQASV